MADQPELELNVTDQNVQARPDQPALGEFRGLLQDVKLEELPPALAFKLAPFDVNGNGIIDPDELPIGGSDHILVKAFPANL